MLSPKQPKFRPSWDNINSRTLQQTLSKPEFSPTSREVFSDFTFYIFSGLRKLADASTETRLFQTGIGYQHFFDEKKVARTNRMPAAQFFTNNIVSGFITFERHLFFYMEIFCRV